MRLKKFFAILFIVSFTLFLYFQFIHTPEEVNQPVSKKGQMHQKTSHSSSLSLESEFGIDENFILISSLITSIFSFFGFILSTFQSMRANRREEEIFGLKREREQLELDRLQAEVDFLRRKN